MDGNLETVLGVLEAMVEDAKQLLTMMVHLLISGLDRAHCRKPIGHPGNPWGYLHVSRCGKPRLPSGYVKIAIENGHLLWIYPLKMVMFHSYVKLPEGSLIIPRK